MNHRNITLTVHPCSGMTQRHRYHEVEIDEDGTDGWIITIELQLDGEKTWSRWGRTTNWAHECVEMLFGDDLPLLDFILDELEDITPRTVQVERMDGAIVGTNTVEVAK